MGHWLVWRGREWPLGALMPAQKLPLKRGGIRVTVQRSTRSSLGDVTWNDDHFLDGCLAYMTGVGTETGQGGGAADVLTDTRTLLCGPGSDLLATDRVILHPQGVDTIPANSPLRKSNVYQVLGEPIDWYNPMTGWRPGMEARLSRIT